MATGSPPAANTEDEGIPMTIAVDGISKSFGTFRR